MGKLTINMFNSFAKVLDGSRNTIKSIYPNRRQVGLAFMHPILRVVPTNEAVAGAQQSENMLSQNHSI